jgi:L-alanine-DL-glutamate epimerase-like enolase superfamily enzyme
MSIVTSARVIGYDLPLKRPWRMAGAEVASRRGWLVALETSDSLWGFGDYVMPPTQSVASGEESDLFRLAQAQVGLGLADACAQLVVGKPAEWAVECALLDACAKQAGLPLCRLLDGAAAARVTVNAVAEVDGVASAVAAGYDVVKMKVGRRHPADEVAQLRSLTPLDGLRLRLDANRAWSWDEACFFLDGVADLPVESLEEPLREPTLDGLERLQNRTGIDLALDESLPSLGLQKVLDRAPVRRLVLKAGGLGGVRTSYVLAGRAKLAGMTCVVTSALDSAIGVAAAAHLAAAVDKDGVLAHGLATAEWLARDVAVPLPVLAGRMELGELIGLGVVPDGVL